MNCRARNLWRGDLSPLGCAAALKPGDSVCQIDLIAAIGAATQPSGDKSPRHRDGVWLDIGRKSISSSTPNTRPYKPHADTCSASLAGQNHASCSAH
ncbi:hypothetical protein C0J56_27770 [Pseudomonas fluorescens]|nr:hypothetical protein C0J56_27770 [Pseudomonas fluorescens]